MSPAASANGAIDIHAHAMPLPVLHWLESNGLADLSEAEQGIVRLAPDVSGVRAGAPLPLAPSMTDPNRRLTEMDATGVAIEAVSLPPFLLGTTSDDGEFVTELVRRGNDALEAYCATAPERLVALSSVPVGTSGAMEEAQRCLEGHGARGVAIGSRGHRCELDDSVNDELWQYLAERRTFVFLHPSATPEAHRLADFWFPQLVGYPIETAVAVARLVFSGVLERAPLTLCLAHGGGCLPALRGRLDMGWERKDVAHTTVAPPRQLIEALYFDTAVFDPVALARLVEDVGADHVLLGTDHPFDLAERNPVEFVRSAGLSTAAERLVLSGNAQALLGLA